MKFSIGDKVLMKRTGDEGRVTAIMSKDMLEVEVDGTAFPVYIEDVDHPYLKWFTEKSVVKKPKPLPEQLPVEKAPPVKERLAKGVYLSFIPVFKTVEMEEVADILKVYLLNELPVNIKFGYDARMHNNSVFSHEGSLHAFGNVYLHSIAYQDMNDQPRFCWELADAANKGLATEQGILKIKPARLFDQVNAVMEGRSSSFSYPLVAAFKAAKPEEDTEAPIVVRTGRLQAVSASQSLTARYELDLHIGQLVDNTRGLTNAEMLQIQLDALNRYLQLAIAARQDRMVVIHGLGKGRLRDEVHAVLKATPEVGRYKNEWSGKYGFGATEILFRY